MLHRFSIAYGWMQGIYRTKSEMENASTLKLFTSCLHLWLQKFAIKSMLCFARKQCKTEMVQNAKENKYQTEGITNEKMALNFRRVRSMSLWFIERNDRATMLWISTDLQGMWKILPTYDPFFDRKKKKKKRIYSWCGMRNKCKMTH